jgi:hypothetical protein
LTVVVVGMVADELGAIAQTAVVPYRGRGRNFDVERRFQAFPSDGYRAVQPPVVPVDIDHDESLTVGALKYLERISRHLFAVCEIDGSKPTAVAARSSEWISA